MRSIELWECLSSDKDEALFKVGLDRALVIIL